MANPQLEEGYLKIANEIQEAFCRFRMPGSTRRVVDAIVYKTYGWNKKEDWISHSQIVQITGMLKGNVSRELSQAIKHGIVIVHDNKLRLNKDYEGWIPFEKRFNPKLSSTITSEAKRCKKLSSTITKGVIDTDNKVIDIDKKVIDTEGNTIHITKDNIHNTGKKEKISEELTNAMSVVLEKFRAETGTRMKAFPKESINNLKYWLTVYDMDDILRAIENIKKDDFWKDKMSLVILFRQKNPKGEPVDWIGDMLRRGDSSYKDALLLSKDHVLATAQLLQINYGSPIQVYDDKGKTVMDAKNMTELQETYSKHPDWAARYTKDKEGNLIYC